MKRHPEAWKIALPSHVLSACRCSQAICSARRRRRDPRIGQRYVRDMLDIVVIFARRKCASAALRRGRAPARCLSRPQSLPKREGLLSAQTPASNFSAAALQLLRPRRNSASFRTFYCSRPPAVFETPCTAEAIEKISPRRGDARANDTQNLVDFSRRFMTGILRLPTCACFNLRADRTASKFSLLMHSGELSALRAESSALS